MLMNNVKAAQIENAMSATRFNSMRLQFSHVRAEFACNDLEAGPKHLALTFQFSRQKYEEKAPESFNTNYFRQLSFVVRINFTFSSKSYQDANLFQARESQTYLLFSFLPQFSTIRHHFLISFPFTFDFYLQTPLTFQWWTIKDFLRKLIVSKSSRFSKAFLFSKRIITETFHTSRSHHETCKFS